MTTMGSRIKEIRAILKMSQEEFGLLFNSGKSYISAVENDKSKLSVENLTKLLLHFHVNVNYILGGIGTPILKNPNIGLKDEILNEVHLMLKNEGIIK